MPAQLDAFTQLAGGHGAASCEVARSREERATLWHARHNAYFASMASRPGSRAMTTDVCVPISKLAACVAAAHEDAEKVSFPVTVVGHVGDGNFHVIMIVDRASKAELAEAEALNRSIVQSALAVGGTCTGEHGIGLGKREFLQWEHGDSVPVMKAIKSALDPAGILNPGKVFS
jgi:D-lactate dehydrogenase (cytochrome)